MRGFWGGKRMEFSEGCLGVIWMRCIMDGRVWLEFDWFGVWDLRGRGKVVE